MNPSVAVVGLGKLGLPLAAAISAAPYGFDVTGCDTSADVVAAVAAGRCPITEPGVAELLSAHPIAASTDIEATAAASDVVFVVVPTPSDSADRFDSSMVVDAVSRLCAGFARRDRPTPPTVVAVSTVMPGTCTGPISDAIRAAGMQPDRDVLVAYSPEFIAIGTVLADLHEPSVVYLGADSDAAASSLWGVLRHVVAPGTPTRRLSLVDAEVAKLAVNVYLSVKIGYANEIAAAARQVGANPTDVLDAVGADHRIGAAFFRHGAPPGGPCLPRDLRAWSTVAPSQFASAAQHTNRRVVVDTIAALADADTVGVLGVAYKPESHIADETFGWQVAEQVAAEGRRVVVHDPHVAAAPAGCERGTVDQVAACDAVVIGCEHVDYAGFNHRRVVRP